MLPLLPDLPRVLAALVLFGVIALLPGWAAGYWLNLLRFRERFFTMRLAIAMCASVAVGPIVFVLVARPLGMKAATAVAVAMAMLGAVALILDVVYRRRRNRRHKAARRLVRVVGVVSIAWIVLALAVLLDVSVANRLYCNVTWIDHCKRVAMIDAVLRTGVPPDSPNSHPGHPIKAFYYYGWYVWAATVQVMGGGLVRSLDVLIAGVVWSGLAFIGSLAVAIHFLGTFTLRRRRVAWIVAVLLLTVTGLDIIPGGLNLLRYLEGSSQFGPRTVEWWNEQVTGFVDMLLWVPHHVSATVAGILALATIRELIKLSRRRAGSSLVAILAIASMATLSLYITLPLAIFLIAYTLWCVVRQQWQIAIDLAICGVCAAALATPFLLDLMRMPGASSGIVLGFRSFKPVEAMLATRDASPAVIQTANLLSLPLNYFLELGFYSVAGFVYWIWRRGRRNERDWFAFGLLCTSFATASFLQSNLAGNDLGWRTILWAQIVLLLWAIEPALAVWSALRETSDTVAQSLAERFPRAVAAMLMMAFAGFCTTAYDLFLLRTSFVFWPSIETEPTRAWALRQAYEWVATNTPRNAIVQYDPLIVLNIFEGLHCNRQLVVADPQVAATTGMKSEDYNKLFWQIAAAFRLQPLPQQAFDLERQYSIDYLVAKDTDALWKQRDSWIWTTSPRFENDRVRVIAVEDLPHEK